MRSIGYPEIERWCNDAVALLEAAGLSPSLAEMQREAIERNSGKKAIYVIAKDLAEGICHLTPRMRDIAQSSLNKSHGFGYEFFTDAEMRRVRSILSRGRIKDKNEYRVLLDVASDTTIDPVLQEEIRGVLVSYETGADERAGG